MVDHFQCRLIWGCDPRRQLEQAWITRLLAPSESLVAREGFLPPMDDKVNVLVESGLLCLERAPSKDRVASLERQRHHRLQALAARGPFGLVHLSDEEGLDGDSLYPSLPKATVIWRNFSYQRHCQSFHASVFPIGPRADFLSSSVEQSSRFLASQRLYPWAFMGTLWSSGSRTLAASTFLRALPKGFFYGGKKFGQGLSIDSYSKVMLQSCFALCPEGDRHLDTFRLHESLQAGCIPVLVDQRNMASQLLGMEAPIPVFDGWKEASLWVQGLLDNPGKLDATQSAIATWWQARRQGLALAMRQTLGRSSF